MDQYLSALYEHSVNVHTSVRDRLDVVHVPRYVAIDSNGLTSSSDNPGTSNPAKITSANEVDEEVRRLNSAISQLELRLTQLLQSLNVENNAVGASSPSNNSNVTNGNNNASSAGSKPKTNGNSSSRSSSRQRPTMMLSVQVPTQTADDDNGNINSARNTPAQQRSSNPSSAAGNGKRGFFSSTPTTSEAEGTGTPRQRGFTRARVLTEEEEVDNEYLQICCAPANLLVLEVYVHLPPRPSQPPSGPNNAAQSNRRSSTANRGNEDNSVSATSPPVTLHQVVGLFCVDESVTRTTPAHLDCGLFTFDYFQQLFRAKQLRKQGFNMGATPPPQPNSPSGSVASGDGSFASQQQQLAGGNRRASTAVGSSTPATPGQSTRPNNNNSLYTAALANSSNGNANIGSSSGSNNSSALSGDNMLWSKDGLTLTQVLTSNGNISSVPSTLVNTRNESNTGSGMVVGQSLALPRLKADSRCVFLYVGAVPSRDYLERNLPRKVKNWLGL